MTSLKIIPIAADAASVEPAPESQHARSQRLLRELWRLLLDALLRLLRTPPEGGLRGSHLSVCREFLRDNGINVRTMQDAESALQQLSDLGRKFDA